MSYFSATLGVTESNRSKARLPLWVSASAAVALVFTDLRIPVPGLEIVQDYTHVVGMALFAVIAGYGLLRGAKVKPDWFLAGMVVFFSFALLSSARPGSSSIGLVFWIYNASAFFFAVVFVAMFGLEPFVEIIRIVTTGLCGAALAIGGLAMVGVRLGPQMPPLFGTVPRLIGVSSHPNTLGQASLVLIFLSVAGGRGVKKLPLALGVVVLLWSGSRTTTMAVVFAIIVSFWLHRYKQRLVVRGGIVALILIAVMAQWFSPVEAEAFSRSGTSTEEITTLTGRTEVWAEVWAMSRSKGWYGHGFYDGGQTLSGLVEQKHNQVGVEHAHNSPLQVLFIAGPVGAAGFAVAVLSAIVRAFRLEPLALRRLLVCGTLLLGLTESITGSGTPWILTVLWFGCLSSLSCGSLLTQRNRLGSRAAQNWQWR